MPIKPNALPSPSPDDRTPDPQTPGTGEEIAQEEQTKRKRRSKAEMIADAVVPADDESVEIKDALTGAKITRPWSEAVALVKAGTSEWADKAMKYAALKAEQQQTTSTFAQEAASAVSEPLTEQSLAEAIMTRLASVSLPMAPRWATRSSSAPRLTPSATAACSCRASSPSTARSSSPSSAGSASWAPARTARGRRSG
jgi:hypothetical protein